MNMNEPHHGDPKDLDWKVVNALGGIHLLALCAAVFPLLHYAGFDVPTFFSWSGLWIAVFLTWVTGGLGITLCFHRLLTHHSFKTPKWLEYILTTFGCLAWQGSPVQWVGMHRLHHVHSDTKRDPHSPRHGFTWAHVLWMLYKKVGDEDGRGAAKDLLRDKGHRVLDRFFWVPQLLLTVLLFFVGWFVHSWELGVSWVLWGVAVRTAFVFNGTWSVNSATHTWGYQNYKDTGDHSTNLWWVAVISFGEGWHNNHHKHPRSAAHGLRWFEKAMDPTYWTIRFLGLFGLATDIKVPSKDELPTK